MRTDSVQDHLGGLTDDLDAVGTDDLDEDGLAARCARAFERRWAELQAKRSQAVMAIFDLAAFLATSRAEIKAKGGKWLDVFDPDKVKAPITFGGRLGASAASVKAAKLLRIAARRDILDPTKLLDRLPPTVEGLYALASLPTRVLKSAIETKGRIWPDMTVRDIDQMREPFDNPREDDDETIPPKGRKKTKTSRRLQQLEEAYDELKLDLPTEALCRLCAEKYPPPEPDPRDPHRFKRSEHARVTDWIKTHVLACHADGDGHLKVLFIIEPIVPGWVRNGVEGTLADVSGVVWTREMRETARRLRAAGVDAAAVEPASPGATDHGGAEPVALRNGIVASRDPDAEPEPGPADAPDEQVNAEILAFIESEPGVRRLLRSHLARGLIADGAVSAALKEQARRAKAKKCQRSPSKSGRRSSGRGVQHA